MDRFWIFTITLLTGGLLLTQAAAAGTDAANTPQQPRYGILGKPAPDLNLSSWIDATGKAAENIRLRDLRGKVIFLYFFQHWCPGCHSHGFPTLQTIANAFEGDDGVVLLAVQTAFEGKHTNTADKLRQNQIDYGLSIPMAHDGGDANPRGIPPTMMKYRSGGTPWTVIIDSDGIVVYNQFHIDPHQAVAMIKALKQ